MKLPLHRGAPNLNEVLEEEEETAPEPTPAPAAAMTREDIAGIVRETVMGVAGLLRPPATPPKEADIDDVPDDDLDAAVGSGTGAAAAIRRAARAEAERATRALKKGHVDPATGLALPVLQKLVKSQAISQMEHYEDFKDEIDAGIAALATNNPQGALDVETLQGIHDYVVGRNWKKLQTKEREAWEREREPDRPTQSRGASRGVSGGPAGKGSGKVTGRITADEVLTEGEREALRDLGRNVNGKPTGKTWEEFCASIGRDPVEYLERLRAAGEA